MIHIIRWQGAQREGPVNVLGAAVLGFTFLPQTTNHNDDRNDDGNAEESSDDRQLTAEVARVVVGHRALKTIELHKGSNLFLNSIKSYLWDTLFNAFSLKHDLLRGYF